MSQQINLFNPAFVTRRKHFSLAAMLQGLGLILAGSLAFYGYAERQVGELEKQKEESARRYQKEQARLARYAAEFSPQRAGQALQDEVRRLEKRVADQTELIEIIKSGAVGNAVGYAEYMRAFARQAPEGLWLTGFGISGDATQISLSGAVLDPELLPEYVQRLGKEGVMRGKAFAMLQMRQPKVESKGADAGKGAIPRYVEFVLHSNPEGEVGK